MPYNSKTKHRDAYKRNYESEDKARRFVHDPFTLKHDKVSISCDVDGKVTLTEDHVDDKGEESYDEMTIPASLIFKIAMMLEMTRSIVYVSNEKKE